MSSAADVTRRYFDDNKFGPIMRDITRPPGFEQRRLLTHPLFVDEADTARAAAHLSRCFDMILRLPEQSYGGDIAAYCEAIGIVGTRIQTISRLSQGPPVRYCRADLYHDGNGFKLLEINANSNTGGTENAELQRALMEHPTFRDFAQNNSVHYIDTGAHIVAAIREAGADVTERPDLRVGIVLAKGGVDAFATVLQANVSMMRRFGLKTHVGELDDLSAHDGKVCLNNEPLDVIVRLFTLGDLIASPIAADRAELVFRAYLDRRVALWTPLNSAMCDSKGALALLSDPMTSTSLTAEERDVVDEFIPWTRLVSAANVDYCLEHQDQLVLKSLHGFGGNEVIPGWVFPTMQWERAVRSAAGGLGRVAHDLLDLWVVQRRVVPRAELVHWQDDDRQGEWAAVWGMFLTPSGHAGITGRVAPHERTPIVNALSSRSTSLACTFVVST